MTNFEMLIHRLPDYYLTEERIDYLKEHHKDRINNADMSGGILDSCLINIKNELNRVYPIEYKVEKKKHISNKVNVFDLL